MHECRKIANSNKGTSTNITIKKLFLLDETKCKLHSPSVPQELTRLLIMFSDYFCTAQFPSKQFLSEPSFIFHTLLLTVDQLFLSLLQTALHTVSSSDIVLQLLQLEALQSPMVVLSASVGKLPHQQHRS